MRNVYWTAICGGLLAVVWFVRDELGTRRAEEMDRELERLRSEVRQLDARSEQRERRLARSLAARHASEVSSAAAEIQTQAPAEPEAAVAANSGVTEPRPAAAEVDEAVVVRDELARVGTWFADEAVDESWATQARPEVQASLQDTIDEHSTLQSLECRASLCRARVVHTGEERRRAFVEGLRRSPNREWRGERLALQEQNPDGTSATVLFYAREGHTFY